MSHKIILFYCSYCIQYSLMYPTLNSSAICFSPLCCVSIKKFLLKKYDRVHHKAKNRNTYPAFLLGSVYLITGNKSITKAAAIQLTVVA